jgi:predicted enzyme related to lactoylglutathione lyase
MVKSINLAWIVVSDFKKSLTFFTEVVGMKLMEKNEEFGWAELMGKDGGSILGIAQERKEEVIQAGKNAVVTFTVDNLEKTKENYKKHGVKLIGETLEIPGHVKMQTFADGDGNLFQIAELIN